MHSSSAGHHPGLRVAIALAPAADLTLDAALGASEVGSPGALVREGMKLDQRSFKLAERHSASSSVKGRVRAGVCGAG